MFRSDGSVLSGNTPFAGEAKFYGLLRVQLSKVVYVDDSRNMSRGSPNPQVLYEGVIIGGDEDGRVLPNIRNGMQQGSGLNCSERILRANDNDQPYTLNHPNSKNPADNTGDLVFVQFVGGDYNYPIIIGMENNPLSAALVGATSSDGPVDRGEYNGIAWTINSQGNLRIVQKGGELDATQNVFITNEAGAEVQIELLGDQVKVKTSKGATLNLKGNQVGLGGPDAEVVDLISQICEILSTTYGNLGFPISSATAFSALKGTVDKIKGGLS